MCERGIASEVSAYEPRVTDQRRHAPFSAREYVAAILDISDRVDGDVVSSGRIQDVKRDVVRPASKITHEQRGTIKTSQK